MERDGARVIHLEIGEPDFAPPPAAVEAARAALAAGRDAATPTAVGLPELREAIAADKTRAHRRRGRPGARARHERHVARDAARVRGCCASRARGDRARAALRLLPELRALLRRRAGRRAVRSGRGLGDRPRCGAARDHAAHARDRGRLAREPDRRRAAARSHGRARRPRRAARLATRSTTASSTTARA